jgi:hypothetical protein
MLKYYSTTMAYTVTETFIEKAAVSPSIGSLDSPADIRIAVEFIKDGHPIGFQFRRVFGICINGARQDMVKKALRLKNEPNHHRPFSGMMTTERFISLIDLDRVHPGLHHILKDPQEFKSIISSICHIRTPIRPDLISVVPPSMLSYENGVPYLHNLDTFGHLVNNLVTALDSAGVQNPAVTTLNITKVQPEITGITTAAQFCSLHRQRCDVPLILADPTPIRSGIQGSFPIIDITRRDDQKLSAVREGHVPLNVIEKILGIELDTSSVKPAAYPQIDFAPILKTGFTSAELRTLALGFIHQPG